MSVSNCKHEEKCCYNKRDEEYYAQQQSYINHVWEMFVAAYNIDKSRIFIDIEAINDVITRVDMREEYFFYFHKGTKINEYKRTALLAFWINKLRPYTYLLSPEEFSPDEVKEASQINERFATFLLIAIIEYFDKSNALSKEYLKKFIYEVKYSLRYRDLTKEALILIMEHNHHFAMQTNDGDC